MALIATNSVYALTMLWTNLIYPNVRLIILWCICQYGIILYATVIIFLREFCSSMIQSKLEKHSSLIE